MDINDAILNMVCGWIVHYMDGTIITEVGMDGKEVEWKKVPKTGIKSLSLKWNTKFWTINGKENYIQKKRGWIIPDSGMEEPVIEYRCIGYWEGNDKVMYKISEDTGKMQMVVE